MDLWDRVSNRRDGPDVALAYGSIFWPDLVEIDGFVLIRENYDPEYLERVRRDCGDAAVEATINTTYLPDLFGGGETTRDAWESIGRLLCETWKVRAEALFPDRKFVTKFSWYSEDADPGITLQQVRWMSNSRE